MLRTGYSTIIKESQDFTFAIFDAQGRMVAQGIPQPLHIGPLAAQVNEIRRRFAATPRRATPSSSIIPIRRARTIRPTSASSRRCSSTSRIVGYIGNTAHKPDLGGKVPGTNAGDATDLFQEGLLIPPLRDPAARPIARRYRAGDLRQHPHAGSHLGRYHARRSTPTPMVCTKFAELFGKYGTDKVLACWQSWMDICETELRKEIAKVPDGLYGPETDYLDDDGIDLAQSVPHLGVRSKSRAIRCTLFWTATRRRAGRSICGPACRRISSSAWSRWCSSRTCR